MSANDSKWSKDIETRRYQDVPTVEVSESWILEELEEGEFGGPRPPTAPKQSPIALRKKLSLKLPTPFPAVNVG